MFKLINNIFFTPPPPAQEENLIGKAKPADGNFNNDNAVLQGDLSIVTIENLMQLVSHAGLSGELFLIAPDNDASFIIRNGALVFGHSKFNSSKLGERLVQAGYITTENLRECLSLYQKQSNDKKLGEFLVENLFISNQQLVEIIKEQVKDCFFDVLSWKQGSFSFVPDETPPKEDILLDERIDHLIIEGIVAIDQGTESKAN